MKKLLLLLSLTLFMVSCGDDDNETKSGGSGLVGKWTFVKITADVKTSNTEVSNTISRKIEGDQDYKGDVEFTEDNKYGSYDIVDKRWYWGIYNINNGVLNICFENDCDANNYVISGNTLIVSWDEVENFKEQYPSDNVTKAVYKIEYKR